MPGGSPTTTTQSSKPWKPAQPYIKEILGEASDIYGQGSTFVPPDQLQTEGLEAATGLARGGNPLAGPAVANAEDIISSGGMNEQQRQVTDALSPYASGDYLGGGNPYLEGLIGRSSDDISDTVRSEMAGLGRTGSGAHQGILADRIGKMSGDLRYNDYGQQVNNQFRAADQIFGNNQSGQNQALQATAMAPGIDAMRFGDANKLMGIGSAYRGFGQEEANVPWQDLSKYAGIINPTSSPYGSQTSTQSGGTSPLSSILGVASLGASMFGGPPGMAAGAGGIFGPLGPLY